VNLYWVRTGDDTQQSSNGARNASPLKMAILPCPRGFRRLEAEMRTIQRAGIDGLVSLLTPEESDEFGLAEEATAAEKAGLRFWSVPVRDHGVPESVQEFAAAVEEIRAEMHAGKAIAAHCYAGIGRSIVLLACILVAEGWSPELAFDRLSEARGFSVPDTKQQEQWVHEYADSLAHGTLLKS
jgi:protein-tyrosine phosphatase